MEIKKDKQEIFKLLETMDLSIVKQSLPKKVENIFMVLPSVYSNLGGITSALRILTYLQKQGCKVTIALSDTTQNVSEAKKNVKECMSEFSGAVKSIDDCTRENFDICIATSWQTVYQAKKLKGYKIYFVQDYEPDFYETNDFSVLAKKTYSEGFHIISLGKWNVKKICENVANSEMLKIDSIDFPYDKNEYQFNNRNYDLYADKKTIKIACYIRYIGRRIPYICEYLLAKTKKELEKKGYDLQVYYFGIDKRNRFSEGTNLGKLSRTELYKLYCECDFGMAASMSNISLVPYEMLGAGLPVIEFQDGSYPYFLGNDTAFLIGYDYKQLADGLLELISCPEKLKEMHQKAAERIKMVSWENTCKQFWKIITKACE